MTSLVPLNSTIQIQSTTSSPLIDLTCSPVVDLTEDDAEMSSEPEVAPNTEIVRKKFDLSQLRQTHQQADSDMKESFDFQADYVQLAKS